MRRQVEVATAWMVYAGAMFFLNFVDACADVGLERAWRGASGSPMAIAFWIWLTLLTLAGLYLSSAAVLDRLALRRTISDILAAEPSLGSASLSLPAPESYLLLLGLRVSNGDAFKLGLLQLITTGVLAAQEVAT